VEAVVEIQVKKMPNIIFIDTCNSTPHLETSFELAKEHLTNGDHVQYIFLGHKLPFEDFLQPKTRYRWFESSPEQFGATLMRHRNFKYDHGEGLTVLPTQEIPEFEDLTGLKQFTYDNYKAGLACTSSLISRLKTSSPDIAEYKSLIKDILVSGISVYEYACSILSRTRPDLVYIFNGRFANSRAVLDAAKKCGVRYLIHERGADMSKYMLYEHSPHDAQRIQRSMKKAWLAEPNEGRKRSIAETFFQATRNGSDLAWKSYIKQQVKGFLPANILRVPNLFTYFSTSDDEFAAIEDGLDWGTWTCQSYAVARLIDVFRSLPHLTLVIRLHPHLQDKHPDELKGWRQKNLPSNVQLIYPNDPVDSYALVDKSKAVIATGSTIGIEAVFWKTPTICIGPSFYDSLDAVYCPKDQDELRALLIGNGLSADPETALPYGYYMATFGRPYKYYQPVSLFAGRFLGYNLQAEHKAKRIFAAARRVEALRTQVVATATNALRWHSKDCAKLK